MLALLRHLLGAEYLYAPHPVTAGAGSLGVLGPALVLMALTVAGALWYHRARRQGAPLTAPRAMLGCTLAAWGMLTTQTYGSGPFSARVWTLTCTALALTVPVASRLAQRRWPESVRTIARALACAVEPGTAPLPVSHRVIWTLGHALALLALASSSSAGSEEALLIAGVAAAAGGCVLLATLVPATGVPASSRRPSRPLRVELLAPLLVFYSASLLQWTVGQLLSVDTQSYQAYPYPDLWSPWFDPAVPALLSAAWLLLGTGAYLRRARPDYARWLRGAALASGSAWLGAVFVRHLSHGAGGSDPYAYLQMAADLAATGDLRHAFPLVGIATRAGVPLWPLVPVGYHPPLSGVAATVWPPGWPTLLAPLYLLGGESLALWGAPLCLLLCAVLTARLACSLWAPSDSCASGPLACAALAGTLVLTSYEALTRALVPMADAAAAAATLLALLALLKARRTDELRWSVMSGIALALAYSVRHPQIALALAAGPALLAGPWPLRRRLAHAGVFALAALAGALPDLWYHRVAFGSPWISESAEWFLLSPANISATLANLWRGDLLRANEFGYMWPLVALGLGAALRNRDERTEAAILVTGSAGVLLFALCYQALRLRDLLPLFPLLALWAARGARTLWGWARSGVHPIARRSAVMLALLTLLATRSVDTLALPLQASVETYGHLTAAQQESYIALGRSLPPSAVVGTAASAGPVLRYAGHEIVRPAAWGAEEFDRFAEALEAAGRPLYLVADGEEMEAWLPQLEGRYRVTRVSTMALPLYGLGGQPLPGAATLYALQRR